MFFILSSETSLKISLFLKSLSFVLPIFPTIISFFSAITVSMEKPLLYSFPLEILLSTILLLAILRKVFIFSIEKSEFSKYFSTTASTPALAKFS